MKISQKLCAQDFLLNQYVCYIEHKACSYSFTKSCNTVEGYQQVRQYSWIHHRNLSRTWYRFSAFWLRSKCSICSYQLNIWYAPYPGASILNWFLNLGEVSGACSTFATGWPGIAVPPGSAHFPLGKKLKTKVRFSFSTFSFVYPPYFFFFCLYFHFQKYMEA